MSASEEMIRNHKTSHLVLVGVRAPNPTVHKMDPMSGRVDMHGRWNWTTDCGISRATTNPFNGMKSVHREAAAKFARPCGNCWRGDTA